MIRPRGSETMFRSARPARFHPSGFLSGADEAYSSLHSQFTLLYLIYAKSVGLSILNLVIQTDAALIVGPHPAVGDGQMSRVLGVALPREMEKPEETTPSSRSEETVSRTALT